MSDISKLGGIGGVLDSGQVEFARMRRQTEQLEELKARRAEIQQEGAKEVQNAKELGKLQGAGQGPDAEKAATDFEALLLQQMIGEMWKAVPSSGLITGSREEEIYRDMLSEQISKQIAETQPLGIKDLILRDMEKVDSE